MINFFFIIMREKYNYNNKYYKYENNYNNYNDESELTIKIFILIKQNKIYIIVSLIKKINNFKKKNNFNNVLKNLHISLKIIQIDKIFKHLYLENISIKKYKNFSNYFYI